MTDTEKEELLKTKKFLDTVSGSRIMDCLVAMKGIADPVRRMAELEAEANRMHDHAAALAAEASKTAAEIKDALKIRGELEKVQQDIIKLVERATDPHIICAIEDIGEEIDEILS